MSLQNPKCAEELSLGIVLDCDNEPRAGVEQELVLVNVTDADSTAITYNATNPDSLMTGFSCKTGKVGFLIDGIKNLIAPNTEAEYPEDKKNGFRHSVSFRVLDPSQEVRDQVNKMNSGALFHAFVERKWKGTNSKDAFLCYGIKYGLEATAIVENPNENNGAIIVTLTTPADVLEPYLPHVLLDTDYATTQTAFNNKFAGS